MKPVDMALFAKKCEPCNSKSSDGDCASAVVASILEVPLAEVPVFVQARLGWFWWLDEWLARRGWVIRTVARENLPMGPVYASGQSPRGFHHAVVWEGGPSGRVAHDPHPSRAGLVGEPEVFHVIERATATCSGCGRAT